MARSGARRGLVLVILGAITACRSRAAPASEDASASTVSAFDPSWCGPALTSSGSGDTSDCGKMSMTGTAPKCLFWAECKDSRFEIDCLHAEPGTCRCDGANGKTVPYAAAFCALDPNEPKKSLRAALDAAARACAWPTAKR